MLLSSQDPSAQASYMQQVYELRLKSVAAAIQGAWFHLGEHSCQYYCCCCMQLHVAYMQDALCVLAALVRCYLLQYPQYLQVQLVKSRSRQDKQLPCQLQLQTMLQAASTAVAATAAQQTGTLLMTGSQMCRPCAVPAASPNSRRRQWCCSPSSPPHIRSGAVLAAPRSLPGSPSRSQHTLSGQAVVEAAAI